MKVSNFNFIFMKKEAVNLDYKGKAVFWLHVVLVIAAWTGPFLFSWQYMVLGFGIIQAQFYIYKSCLMNAVHGLEEEDNTTFYSHLFESWGFKPNRKKLKFFIRQILYIALGLFSIFWQAYLGNEALLF